MPEIRKGSLHMQSDQALPGSGSPRSPTSPGSNIQRPGGAQTPTPTSSDPRTPTSPNSPVAPDAAAAPLDSSSSPSEAAPTRPQGLTKEKSDLGLDDGLAHAEAPRKSLSYNMRTEASAYYDSRAASRKEFKRRGRTLQEYYEDNPNLLPQLPFTWHHGKKRWRLFLFAFLVFVDASAVPIALYYGMRYAGDVEGWIIFAVVTTIWGGPTYLEFAIRTLRLIKKERFYRPLGTTSRWCFDMLHWSSSLTIFVVTALFIVGSAPHVVWLRVLCMPAPAILYCYGGVLTLINIYHVMNWPAPFRISSTAKGGKVLPGAYYFMEDTVAVNAGAGRPYREALAARYKASPRFRRMLYVQSWFWGLPALILAVPLTVIAVIPPVPATGAYGVCWAVPFIWATIWGVSTVYMCKRDMRNERLEWQASEAKGRETPTKNGAAV
ncbi:hypothetical protein S40285_05946 [Stachybotrys chlorohalonatus IBT 40285]|uniref:Uncharacterized protein n=1 Tax=Stachybotrys chlorohalonatus (strain IBT 40285) TaxID=1283841 RepID=A0A084QVE5_STAC4|nr:hypothetical protein S40285_05946 [Stachybotrys chlorohalonata IBT 40285]